MGQLLLRFLLQRRKCPSNQPFLLSCNDDKFWLCSKLNIQGAFLIIFFICSDLLNCLRSVGTIFITIESDYSSGYNNSLLKAVIFRYFDILPVRPSQKF